LARIPGTSSSMPDCSDTGAQITVLRLEIEAICGANGRASHIIPGSRTNGVI